MKLVNLWACLFWLLCAGNVQAAGYSASITTAYPALAVNPSATQVTWTSCNTTGPWPSAIKACDDGVSKVLPIGFTFNFAGTNYNYWSMSTNGVIYFETASSGNSTGSNGYTPGNLPSTALGSPAKAALMPFWADLMKNASAAGANDVGQPANASFFQYEVLTQATGTQVLVVQLKNVVYYGAGTLKVNMQVQLWSTGEIVYSYGAMEALTSNPKLRIGLQSAGGAVCHTLASNQTTALSNQSFVYQWSASAPACDPVSAVNHYEIRHDGAATLCAEPVTVLACSSATKPCPAANILSSLITAQVTVSGLTNVNISPPSFNIQPLEPVPKVNLTWASGSAGTATLGLSAAVPGSVSCTNAAGTANSTCTVTVSNMACIAPPHHFQIVGPANGTNCANQTFTIKAWADVGQTSAYTAATATGTLTSSGNPASLPSLGAFTIPAGSSTVTISPIGFPAPGTTTFSTTATPALAGATTCSFGGATSCAFAVTSCVGDFNCVETTAGGASAADANAATGRIYTKRAGTAFSLDVVARKSDGTVATTYAGDAAKSVTVELVDGSGATACAARSALSPAVSTTQNFVAGDAGRKTFSFTVAKAYPDLRCRVTDNTTSPAIAKTCSVDDFAVRPSAVTLATTASAAAPPAADAASATPTVKAGAGFTLQASTSTGTNYVGTLSLDNTKLTAQTTTQASTLQIGGTVGDLTPTTLGTNPVTQPTDNATYSEVGFLYLAAGAFRDNANPAFTAVDSAAGDCIATSFADTLVGGKYGCLIGNATAVSLGRFVPDHFDTTVEQTTSPIACPTALTCPTNATDASGLLYANQAVAVKVTAKNAIGTGDTTTNYQGVFAKATTVSAWGSAGSTTTANPSGGTLTNPNLDSDTFVAGVGTAPASTPNATQPTYALGTTTAAPVNVHFRAMDTDNTTSLRTGAVEAGLKVANGRVKLANAYGSERLALPIVATVQYHNGTNWVTSLTDGVTAFDTQLSTATPAGNLVTSTVTGLSAGLTVVSPSSLAVTNGVRTFKLTAPMAAGSANLSLNAPIYLPSTTGRATFGLFKSPLIYMRENH